MQSNDVRLIEQIHSAFPNEPIESDGAFGKAGTTYPDATPYMKQIAGKSWAQLDREYIVRRSDALGFLTSRHLIAVLPVYLCALVEDGVWSPAVGMLMLILTRPVRGKHTGLGRAGFGALVETLTDEQRTAVACVLRAFSEKDPDGSLGKAARAALEDYWTTYLPAGE